MLKQANSGLAGMWLVLVLVALVSCRDAENTAPKPETAPPKDPVAVSSQALFVNPDAGKTWNIFGLQIVGKIMSAETGGAYSVVMSTTPPNGGPPPHVHEHEDELFYVLAGEYEFRCGEDVFLARKGALVHLPRGIPHSFRNIGDSTGVLMNTITPGGFENFFDEVDQLPKDKPLDRTVLATIAAKYGLTFLTKE